MNGHPTTAGNTRTSSEIDLLKIDLAVAHRLCAKFGLGALSQTHLSARYGSECLICDLPTVWSSVSPENISMTSTDIDAIHRGIYNSREDVKAVIHLRSPAATAVSCLEDGFQFLSYDSAPFHKKLAACECRGDAEAVSKNVAVAACSVDGCNTILLQNNGCVCFGQSMRDAWILAHRFEECSKVQLEVMKSGGKAREMNDSDFEQAAESGIAQNSTPPCSWDYLSESVGL
jgi:ribulose-5-phosphate 4-epimerase/fuculose-1-phosphate aldolase